MIENEDEPIVAKSRNGKKHFFAPSASPEVESMGSALLNLSFYSFLMFTVPLGVFFIAKDMFVDYNLSDTTRTILPVILSILSVNIIIVLYVVSAFRRDALERKNKIE